MSKNHETKVCRSRKFYLNFDRKIIDLKTVAEPPLCLTIKQGGYIFWYRNPTLFENTQNPPIFTKCASTSIERKVKSLKHFQRAIKRQNYWKSFIVSKWDISNKLVGWTILAHIKAVKCSTYLSFSTWHSILDTLSLWPIWFYMGQIKCLVINCKAISIWKGKCS